ncbi:MAG: periplasmic component of amino acid ABC-type transporter/signal transduction system [Anaerocolumna sp.]|jgi:polar amino acid transport system substrate-binding protein|nr:periplasmic component of amino acid ABC-type transporter/signal transduction system [Anaerocolumna sp.]
MKKIIKLMIVLVMIAAFTVACGTKGKDTDVAATGETNTDGIDTSLDDIKAKGKLVLGLDDAFPPMGFQNDNQEIVGFDIDVAKEVAKRMGVELVLQPISWEAKELELSTKNIDCIWNGMSYNKDRDEAMTLSVPYMKNTQVAVVLATSDVNTLADLAGKTVVIQNGSTASDAMDANEEFKNSLKELVKVEDNVQALLDLKVSGSDAVVMDEVVARYYTEKEAGIYKILDEKLADEDYVIGFRKGDTALNTEVEKHLKDMDADGTLAQISETWFGTDLTTIK